MRFKKYTMSELISDISMGPFGSNIKKENYTNTGVPYLNGSNLSGFALNETQFNFVTEEKADSLGRSIAHKRDVLVTHRGTLGQIAYIPENSKYSRYVTGNSQFRFTCNDLVLPQFIVYYFHTPLGQHKLLSNASQVGVPALARPTSTFQKLEVEIPTVDVQYKICDMLQCLQDKIATNQKINDNLQQQAYAYFLQLFIDKADPSWRVGTIADLGTVVGGGTPSKAKPEYYTDNGIAWITPKDLSIDKSKFIAHGENDISELGYRNSSATMMPAGTVLFSSRAPIGYIAISSNEVTTNQGFKSVVPRSEIGTPFVYYFLIHNLPLIESKASGSTFKEVSGSVMKSVEAVIPDSDTIAKFNNFCHPIFEMQKNLELENRKLAAMRDSLLPRLMSGEINVSDIDI